MDVENPDELRQVFQKILDEGSEEAEFNFENDRILHQLHSAVLALKKEFNWTNAKIINKGEELKKFKAAKQQEKLYRPNFKFKTLEYEEDQVLALIDKVEAETDKIDRETVKTAGFKTLDRKDLRNLYRGIFEEFKLYVKLNSRIAQREQWKEICGRLWSRDQKTARYAKKKLEKKKVDGEKPEKDLAAKEVKEMWENEVKRLGLDYRVAVKNVSGCHNVPEKKTLVVAAGSNDTRNYSLEEARMLTMHEIFHAVRSHNGYKAVEGTDLPPTLGIHTPFYDRAEEGGAVLREVKTRTITERKERDYYLRTLAADMWHQDNEFYEIVVELMRNGATLGRAFGLAARNREFIRHQIYLGGMREWQNLDDKEPWLMGKVNQKWAEKFWKEAGKEGPITRPDVKPKDLFQNNSFAFDA